MEQKILEKIVKAMIKTNTKMFDDVYKKINKIDSLLLEIKNDLDEDRKVEKEDWEVVEKELIESNEKLKEEIE